MLPVGATRQENITAESFWPFLIRSAVSILFISESVAVPMSAGRNSGIVGLWDGDGDAVFGVCDEARLTPSSKPIMQKIPSRMAKYASESCSLCKSELLKLY